jgi:hypothetical protein
MPKRFFRITAFLLVPCLIADPALALSLQQSSSLTRSSISSPFLMECLSSRGEVEPSGQIETLNGRPTRMLYKEAGLWSRRGVLSILSLAAVQLAAQTSQLHKPTDAQRLNLLDWQNAIGLPATSPEWKRHSSQPPP